MFSIIHIESNNSFDHTKGMRASLAHPSKSTSGPNQSIYQSGLHLFSHHFYETNSLLPSLRYFLRGTLIILSLCLYTPVPPFLYASMPTYPSTCFSLCPYASTRDHRVPLQLCASLHFLAAFSPCFILYTLPISSYFLLLVSLCYAFFLLLPTSFIRSLFMSISLFTILFPCC